MYPYVYCSILYNCQDLEAAKYPLVDEWIKKLRYIYTMEYYSAVKKKEICIITFKIQVEDRIISFPHE